MLNIKELSRQKYGRPISEVEAYISKRAGFDEPKPEAPSPQATERKKFIPF